MAPPACRTKCTRLPVTSVFLFPVLKSSCRLVDWQTSSYDRQCRPSTAPAHWGSWAVGLAYKKEMPGFSAANRKNETVINHKRVCSALERELSACSKSQNASSESCLARPPYPTLPSTGLRSFLDPHVGRGIGREARPG